MLKEFLRQAGLDARVERAQVLVEWASFVGPQIASVTEPRTVTEDGTLFVGVKTHGWMSGAVDDGALAARENQRADGPRTDPADPVGTSPVSR